MPLRRLLTRSLVSLGVVAGLGAAFVAGTSYGDPGGTGGSAQHPTAGADGDHGSDASPAAYTDSGLTLADSCPALLASYVGRGEDLVGPYGWGGYAYPLDYGGMAEDAVPGAASAPGAAGDAARSPLAPAPVRSTNGETGTNVQEAGVDEPDVVKTDGRSLFRLQDGELVVYDVSGADVERIASLAIPGADRDTELLLSEDTVVVLSHRGGDGSSRPAETTVTTVDVSDPAAPEVAHTMVYDTELVTARLHDGVVRLVLQAGLPDLDFRVPNKLVSPDTATRENQELVRQTTISDWLPTVSVDGAAPEPLLGCDQVAVPETSAALGTIAVVGFDAPAPDAASVSGLAVDTDLVYASADQLYLATSPSPGVFYDCMDCTVTPQPFPMPDVACVTEDGAGDTGDSGDAGNPLSRLRSWLTGHGRCLQDLGPPTTPVQPYDGTSHLYAFDLDGIDTTFAASGEVDGEIRDRWSMDAVGSGADAVLRVAVGPNSRTGNFNSIVTFRQDGNDLVESGRLDDLGVGEELESVRWFDTLAIVVTFRQVDPMYAVDLTDPDQPRLMGSLKIPGYSAYLHPLGQHRLLGLGQGAGEAGQWGAQAGLFNVTDLTHPTQLDTVSYGPDSQALATQDPRQLTWLPDGRTVLTVVSDYGVRGDVGYVSVLSLGDGHLSNRMVEVEYGDEVGAVRLVPLADGRVVLVTGDDASFFDLTAGGGR